MELVLHATTKQQLVDVVAQPPHALIIIGPAGAGKTALAKQLCSNLLNIAEGKVDSSSAILQITPDGESISIEAVRQIQHFMKLRVTGTQTGINRLALITDAHLMGREAQNALLKTIEEPPASSMLILTAISDQALLPTIVSRSQLLMIRQVDAQQLEQVFVSAGNTKVATELALRISGGLPGLTAEMLEQGSDHRLVGAADLARQLLGQTTFERLSLIDGLSKQRQVCLDLCYILQQMAHLALQTAQPAASQRWQTILSAAYDCNQALSVRANTKLALTSLMLTL